MNQLAQAPEKEKVNHTDMVHITVLGNPYLAVCGAKLRGHLLSHVANVDCIICQAIKDGYA